MKQSAAYLFVTLILCSCQATIGQEGDEDRDLSAIQNPAIAATIASDLSGDLAPFIAEGSALSLKDGNEAQALSSALGEALIRRGYRLDKGNEQRPETVQLQIWSAEVEGDLFLAVSTPSHRLSRVYRQGGSSHSGTLGPVASGGVIPAGPLVVETIIGGTS